MKSHGEDSNPNFSRYERINRKSVMNKDGDRPRIRSKIEKDKKGERYPEIKKRGREKGRKIEKERQTTKE